VADGVAGLLEQARAGVRRLTPQEALEAAARGALLVDTRTEWQEAGLPLPAGPADVRR
jgi:hypothetical protein